jgi:hypothetical protein
VGTLKLPPSLPHESWMGYVSTLDEREDGAPMPELKDIKFKYYANRDSPGTKGLGDEPYEGGLW